jgi:hypothetical protein
MGEFIGSGETRIHQFVPRARMIRSLVLRARYGFVSPNITDEGYSYDARKGVHALEYHFVHGETFECFRGDGFIPRGDVRDELMRYGIRFARPAEALIPPMLDLSLGGLMCPALVMHLEGFEDRTFTVSTDTEDRAGGRRLLEKVSKEGAFHSCNIFLGVSIQPPFFF